MHTILASTLIGGLYLAVLFALCFGTVVGGKLLRRYLRERKKPPAPPPAAQDAPPPNKVYYLVEKKRVAPKAQYGKPKEIDFK